MPPVAIGEFFGVHNFVARRGNNSDGGRAEVHASSASHRQDGERSAIASHRQLQTHVSLAT